MDSIEKFRGEFIENSCYRMEESLRMVTISLDQISEEQLWLKPNSSLNSIGTLILHLCGNMTQYGIASLLELKDARNRDAEFAADGGYSKKELLDLLSTTIDRVKNCMNTVTLDRLISKKQVQGFEFSGIGNIVHLVEHLSYHTGQIAFWVKQLKNEQLGFYDGHDLNTKNQN